MTNPTGEAMTLPRLRIAQIVLEEARFGHVGDFLARDLGTPFPDTPGEIGVQVRQTSDKTAIVRLKLVSNDPTAAYHYTISYVVLFEIEGAGPPDLDKRLAVTGANMAMPFVRELVANLTGRGRFGVRWVGPMNFNKMIAEAENEGGVATEGVGTSESK